MNQFEAHAWKADWLVAWLASVGVTYLDRSVQLSWSRDPVPHAVFWARDEQQIESTFPAGEIIDQLAISPEVEKFGTFSRKHFAPSSEYIARSRLARLTADLTLGSTMSDIGVQADEELPHSPFDPAAPGSTGSLGKRLQKVSREAESLSVRESMTGTGEVVAANGLGYDMRRLKQKSVPGAANLIDPVVETFALFGSLLFTQRGPDTRGWTGRSMFKAGAFSWPTWSMPLGWAGVDAALDLHYAGNGSRDFDGSPVFDSVAYNPTASADVTRGFDGVQRR